MVKIILTFFDNKEKPKNYYQVKKAGIQKRLRECYRNLSENKKKNNKDLMEADRQKTT